MRKAVIIGINYMNTDHELHGCINDAVAFKQLLLTKFGHSEANIRTLTDDTKMTIPNVKNILAAISWLVTGAKPGDQLVFYYSGHGSSTMDTSKDESDGIDELMYVLDGAISDDELMRRLVIPVPNGASLTCVFDCCRSSTIMDLRYNLTCDSNNVYSMSIDQSNARANVVCLSGCRDDQSSEETQFGSKPRGAMTYFLEEVLRSMAYRVDNGTLLQKLTQKLAAGGWEQMPQLSCTYSRQIEEWFSL
jgi:hypothetical protein